MKRADNFCILPLLTYSAHSAGLAWQEENGAKFIWPLSFFSPLFSIACKSCWFAESQVTELWVVCPTAPLFWSVLQQKLEKPVHLLFFFFFLASSSLQLVAAACTHADKVVPTSHVESCRTKTGCILHYPRVFLASYRLWWMIHNLNSICSLWNVFRSLSYFSSSERKVCLRCTHFK